jgi:hypothetical protein
MPRIPDWLTTDLVIISFSIAVIGTVYWIAP